MATRLEQRLAKMSPEERKKTVQEISDMMGMPPKKKTAKSTKSTAKKKKK